MERNLHRYSFAKVIVLFYMFPRVYMPIEKKRARFYLLGSIHRLPIARVQAPPSKIVVSGHEVWGAEKLLLFCLRLRWHAFQSKIHIQGLQTRRKFLDNSLWFTLILLWHLVVLVLALQVSVHFHFPLGIWKSIYFKMQIRIFWRHLSLWAKGLRNLEGRFENCGICLGHLIITCSF